MKKTLAKFIILSTLAFPIAIFALCGTNTNSGSFVSASTMYGKNTSANGINGGSISYGAWIYPTTLPSAAGNNQLGIMQISSQTNSDSYQMIYYTPDNVNYEIRCVRTKHGVGSQTADWVSGNINNTWTHIVCNYDGVNITTNHAVAAGTHSQGATTAASGDGSANNAWDGITMAGWSGADQTTYAAPGQTFGGQIDDARIYSASRSNASWDTDFQTQLAGNETNLLAYYRMNNDWNDLTANALNLTAVNSPTFSTNVAFAGTACATATLNDDDWLQFLSN